VSASPEVAPPVPGAAGRSYLSIGEVAARTGHTPSGLRHWESVGLLPPPPRVGGKRRYSPAVLDRIAVIDLARQAGFTLTQVRVLVDGVAAGAAPPEQWATLADEKLAEVDALIARAQATRRLLEALRSCACPTLEECAGRPSPR
jgi:MerR family transcriptional regulator, redox-sensitive transcriptional activator SoxR